jgi:hypothetical protein
MDVGRDSAAEPDTGDTRTRRAGGEDRCHREVASERQSGSSAWLAAQSSDAI